MQNLSVKARLILVLLMALGSCLLIAINSTLGMQRLGVKENEGHDAAEIARLGESAANVGGRLYQIIAYTTINHQFDEAAKEWAKGKQEEEGLG